MERSERKLDHIEHGSATGQSGILIVDEILLSTKACQIYFIFFTNRRTASQFADFYQSWMDETGEQKNTPADNEAGT